MKSIQTFLTTPLMILLAFPAFAQEAPSFHSSFTGKIVPAEEGFIIEGLNPQETTMISLEQLALNGSDLTASLKLPGFSSLAEEKNASYQIGLKYVNARGESTRPGMGSLSGATIDYFRGERAFKITWKDFVESDFFLPGGFELLIETVIQDIAPSLYLQPPQFSSTTKWVSGLAMGGGLALMGTGYLVRQSSEDDYETYKRMVFEEDPQASGQLSQSNNKKVTSDFLLISGGAALAAGGLYFALKYLPYRQKRKVYNKYQNMLAVEVQPATYGWVGNGSAAGGLRFILHF